VADGRAAVQDVQSESGRGMYEQVFRELMELTDNVDSIPSSRVSQPTTTTNITCITIIIISNTATITATQTIGFAISACSTKPS
jgi:hypothetical protein